MPWLVISTHAVFLPIALQTRQNVVDSDKVTVWSERKHAVAIVLRNRYGVSRRQQIIDVVGKRADGKATSPMSTL